MQLTGTILFIGALIGMLIWIYRSISIIISKKTFIRLHLGEKTIINIMPGIVFFIVMAISAGMAWG